MLNVCILPKINTCKYNRSTKTLFGISPFVGTLRITVPFSLICAGLAATKAVQSLCEYVLKFLRALVPNLGVTKALQEGTKPS